MASSIISLKDLKVNWQFSC